MAGQEHARACRKAVECVHVEALTGAIEGYTIGRDDAELLGSALGDFWAILESNGYTIDIDTNRLRAAILGLQKGWGTHDLGNHATGPVSDDAVVSGEY